MAVPPDESPRDRKRLLRAAAVERRRLAHAAHAAAAADTVAERFLALSMAAGGIVAAYWPIGDELDPRPLMAALAEGGGDVALPVVAAPRLPLEFRRWRPGEAMEPGAHGTWHPAATAATVVPDVLLVPLLAFDRGGHRLGYGGGYYDRTLEALRRQRQITAVGLAYAAQEVSEVPADHRDQRLDWIVTEKEMIATGRTAA